MEIETMIGLAVVTAPAAAALFAVASGEWSGRVDARSRIGRPHARHAGSALEGS